MNHTGIPQHNRMIRNIKVYKAVGRNHHVVSNFNITDNCCVDADVNSITQNWSTTAFSTIFRANRASLMQTAIIANHNAATDRNVIGMSKVQAFSTVFWTYLKAVFFRKAM